MKILVAEDDAVARKVLTKYLEQWGYQIQMCNDGNTAWQMLQAKDAPRIVLLDWVMPGLTGPQICTQLRRLKNRPYSYILLLTAKNKREDMIQGLAAGADVFMSKPIEAKELEIRLEAGKRLIESQDSLLNEKFENTERTEEQRSSAMPRVSGDMPEGKAATKKRITELPWVPSADLGLMHYKIEKSGGDFFDIVPLKGKLCFLIGEVGPGLDPQKIQEFIATTIEETGDPKTAFDLANQKLAMSKARGMYVSAAAAVYSPSERTLKVVRAGQTPPLMISSNDSTLIPIDGTGMRLALTKGNEFTKSLEYRDMKVKSGNLFVLHTEGMVDSVNADKEQFGIGRVVETLETSPDQTAKGALAHLKAGLDAFLGPTKQKRDFTAIAIHFK